MRYAHSLLCLLLAAAGCDGPSTHSQLGWVASDFFNDPQTLALCDAILADDLAAMQRAVDAGADINAVGKHGMTPLLWAFPDHKPKRFRWLLERGANPNVCVTKNLSGGLRYVDRGTSVMHLAIESAWPDYYRWVLDHGGDPNLMCAGQREPLLHVAFGPTTPNKEERINALLGAGADINAKGSVGSTLTIAAAALGYFEISLMLVKRGADVYLWQDGQNRQLAHWVLSKDDDLGRYSEANRTAYYELIEMLRRKGVDIARAREDLARWESWRGLPDRRQRHLREIAERAAREAEQAPKPEPADPNAGD